MKYPLFTGIAQRYCCPACDLSVVNVLAPFQAVACLTNNQLVALQTTPDYTEKIFEFV
jgi:hypothetical protein